MIMMQNYSNSHLILLMYERKIFIYRICINLNLKYIKIDVFKKVYISIL